jgi:hypothetical protein
MSITHPFYYVSYFTALHIAEYDKKYHAQNILLLNSVNLILVNSKYCSVIPENMTTYEVVSKRSQTVIPVTASMKEDESGGQGHTSKSLLHQSAM